VRGSVAGGHRCLVGPRGPSGLLAAALSAGAHAVTGRLPFPGTGEAHVAVGAEGIWLATQNAVYRIGE